MFLSRSSVVEIYIIMELIMLSKNTLIFSNILSLAILVFVLLRSDLKEENISQSNPEQYSYFIENKKLQSIYTKIKEQYIDDELFLKKLALANEIWIKSTQADFALKFPHSEESGYYGSVFTMCAKNYKDNIIARRLDFLTKWVEKTEEGDVCSGSVKYK
ncbi:MAG: hypothetical protein HRT87_09835 [Legionellales bacterium]|nr:hypothetical protein [Legionellales bacterium]